MANFADSRSTHFSIFLFVLTLTLTPNSISIAVTHNFDPLIALFGDAQLSADRSRVVLTHPSLLILRRPFSNPTSFSTDLVFSGDGISLVLVPEGFDSNLSAQTENGLFVFAKVSWSSSKLESHQKLKSWIDYDASSKRLEVRLAKFGESRPYIPIVALGIDFPAMWKDMQLLVGLASSHMSSTVYSWNFRLRNIPKSIHSIPVDPTAESKKKKRFCPTAVLGGLIVATVCGALMAFSVLFVWAMVANRHTIQARIFNYQKIGVVVDASVSN